MTDKIIIRPSSLTAYLDCSRRAIAGLFPGAIKDAGFDLRDTGRNIGACIGTSVHKAAWYTLDQKIRTGGSIGTDEDAIDAGVTTFREEIEDGVRWDESARNANEGDQHIIRMTKMYRHRLVKEINPLSIEERLEASFEGVIISGQKDVLTREPNDLRDLKTGKAKTSHAAQLGAYSLIERSHGREVMGVKEDFLQRVSLRRPQPEPVTLTYDIGTAENLALEVIEQIQSDVAEFQERLSTGRRPPENAFRPNPSSMLCSDKYCPAWGTNFCRAHRPPEPENDDE